MFEREYTNVSFRAAIVLDETAYNHTKWVTVYINPIFNNYFETVKEFRVNVDGNFSIINHNNSAMELNISINELNEKYWIKINGSFLLYGNKQPLRESEYSYYYIGPGNADTTIITFIFPNYYKLTYSPPGGSLQSGTKYQLITYYGEDSKRFLYFQFLDTAEQNQRNKDKASKDMIRNVGLSFIIGIITGLLANKLYEKYFKKKRNKKLKHK